MSTPQGPENIDISATQIGEITFAPPTFLERWGVVFLACAGAWILAVGTALLIYFFWKQPAFPSMTGQTPDQVTQALSVHKQLSDQWSESLTSIFDLLVTKTVLPIVTLLLGYLFGKAKSGG
jgi:uncharacterized membrane protein YraQ (UPF0718 family)